MGIIRYIVVFGFILVSTFSFSQEKYDIELINGRSHYVFIVQQGNTVYGITRLFKIDEKDLYAANPGMSTSLDLGQKIVIPVDKSGYKQDDVMINSTGNFKKHTVSKDETFYGLSRKYGVSIQEIKDANPGLDGLKKDEVINIPVKGGETIQKDPVVENNNNQYNEVVENNLNNREYEWNDSIVKHKVLPHETLYSISKRYMVSVDTLKEVNGLKNNKLSKDQELIIPLKQVKFREVLEKAVPPADTTSYTYENSEMKEVYNITLMLPLYLDRNAAHLSKGSLTSPRDILPKTKIALDFYMGFLVAVDSLEKAGVKLNVQVLDTRGDSATVANLLRDKNVADADLIIGPFFSRAIPPVADFAKQHKIHQVLPFSASNRVLFDNPYVSKFVASNAILVDGTMQYVKDRYQGKNIVLIKSTYSKDKYAYQRAKEFLDENKMVYTEKPLSTGDMRSYFKKDEVNVVLAPSSNQIFATNIFVGLNKTLNKFGYKDSTVIHLFGTDNWERFDGIKMKYKTRMNFHYASPIYVDWNNIKVQKAIKQYRTKFETDPTEYALHGLDLSMFYLSGLKLFGTGFYQYFNNIDNDPYVNRIQIDQLGETNGFENSSFFIVRYLPNYTKFLTK